MFLGVFINLIVLKLVKREVEKVNFVVMKLNVLYLLIDVYILLGVVVSFLVVILMEWYIFDFIIGMVFVVYIIYEVFKLMKEVFLLLIDICLLEEEEKIILKIIDIFY